jgi:O-6-methylguanine DNA methyltransferase
MLIFDRNPTLQAMESEHKWIVVRIDGKIAAVSTDYRLLASISATLAKGNKGSKKGKARNENGQIYDNITATAADLEEVWKLKQESTWDDLFLFGTEFQKKVWRKLWDLSHQENGTSQNTGLISYSDFAELCQNRAGVRAVAHAIGLNPVSVIIPCHLVIPKESIDKIKEIHKKAEATIFKGDDLCINSILSDSSIDFGEYALGRKLKRKLILKELANGLL